MFYCNALKSWYQLFINSLTTKVKEYTEIKSLIFIKFDVEVLFSCIDIAVILLIDANLFCKYSEIIIALAYRNAIKGGTLRKLRVTSTGSLGLNITLKSNHIRHDVSSCDLHLRAVHCLGGFHTGECCNNPKGKLYYG